MSPDPKGTMPSTFASLADRALETTIVGSFTRLGPAVRRRLFDWDEPARMDGQRVLLTGGTSGIGRAAAAQLASLGAEVTITSRSRERADAAADELASAVGGDVRGEVVDTGDLDTVLDLARRTADRGPLDVVIHNAGALTDERRENAQGMELTLASHLIGPYLLTRELRSSLRSGARVVWMASGGMYSQGLDVDRLEMGDDYRGAVAYARAKRAQVELVALLGPAWAPAVSMYAMHPGWVDTPGVDQGLPGFGRVMGPLLRSPESGADTLVWLASGASQLEPGSFVLDRRSRGTTYLPGTGTDDTERKRLLEWLELHTLPALAGS